MGWGGVESGGKSSLEILDEILTLKEDQNLFEASMTIDHSQRPDIGQVPIYDDIAMVMMMLKAMIMMIIDGDDETLHLHFVKQVWPPAKNWAETSLKMLSASNVQVKIQASCRKVKIGRQMNKDPN